jgi:hypothetical protein
MIAPQDTMGIRTMKRKFAALLPSGCFRREVAETAYQEAARRHRQLMADLSQ